MLGEGQIANRHLRHARAYMCHRASGQVVVDGRLDKPVWQTVPWTDDFVDILGERKPRPRFRTRAKMLWDDDYFYVAAELEEPHVWGTIAQKNAVMFYDNDFEVFIDPDGDNHNYYEFEAQRLMNLPAESLEELGIRLAPDEVPGLLGDVSIARTPDGWHAWATAADAGGARVTWHTQQDSRLWATRC